jgi:hypothetical protein
LQLKKIIMNREVFHYVRNYIVCVEGLLRMYGINIKNNPELFRKISCEEEKMINGLRQISKSEQVFP